ncbi:MAG: NFACT family protein [Limnochordia bacterium]|nr:NFACT family protein [Limnochordia bacterium]
MPFDGVMLAAISHEITPSILGARIARIYQPDPTTVVLGLRRPDEEYQLLFSTEPTDARLHLVQQPFEQSIYAFGLALRKILIGGQIVDTKQPDWDRLFHLRVETEEGTIDLVAEIMGRHSNLIAVDTRTREILAVLKPVTERMSRYRQVLPGLRYIQPPAAKRRPFYPLSKQELTSSLDSSKQIDNALLQGLLGLSPLLIAEILYRSEISPSLPAHTLDESMITRLHQELESFGKAIAGGHFSPTMIMDQDGKPLDIAATRIHHLAHTTKKSYTSPSALVSDYFRIKADLRRCAQLQTQLMSVISNQLKNCQRKVVDLNDALARAENADEFRKLGELLTANLHLVKRGQTIIKVTDYYDPNQREVAIELDPKFTPAAMAEQYFRMYQKAKRGRKITEEHLESVREEIDYLLTVQTHIELGETVEDLERIKAELMEQGYIATPSQKSREGKRSQPLIFRGPDSVLIQVGRNNKENDQLTLKLARPHDIWLHTKQIPGSHVIIRAERKMGDLTEIPEHVLVYAAQIAAYFSKARQGQNIPVDYTFVKYVRKPSGARPGFVIYENYRTINVNPKIPKHD